MLTLRACFETGAAGTVDTAATSKGGSVAEAAGRGVPEATAIASVAATVALAITIVVWSPQRDLVQTGEFKTPPLAAMDLNADLPDIDFLEELELLQELELLSQIEGV